MSIGEKIGYSIEREGVWQKKKCGSVSSHSTMTWKQSVWQLLVLHAGGFTFPLFLSSFLQLCCFGPFLYTDSWDGSKVACSIAAWSNGLIQGTWTYMWLSFLQIKSFFLP